MRTFAGKRKFVEPCELCLKEEVGYALHCARIGLRCYAVLCDIAHDARATMPDALQVEPYDGRAASNRATPRTAEPKGARRRVPTGKRLLTCSVPGCGTFEHSGPGRKPRQCSRHVSRDTLKKRKRRQRELADREAA